MKRTSTPSFVMNLKLNTTASDVAFLEKRFSVSNKVHNLLISHVKKRIRSYQSDPEYKRLMQLWHQTKSSKVPAMKRTHADINEQLKALRLRYGLSEYQLYHYVKILQHTYKKYLHSQSAQAIASDVWKAADAFLFVNGKHIHYSKLDCLDTIHGGNTNNTGIRFLGNCIYVGKYRISVSGKRDTYEEEALRHRIKFCRIKRIPMGDKYHYYVQLVLEGIPPKKHITGSGRTGIDIGTSTVAVVSEHKCMLEELGKDAQSYDRELKSIHRAMDRSRRASNPGNYHPDGTIKRGRKKWIFSKSYKKLRMHKKTLEWKQSVSLKQSHCNLANRILRHGTDVYVEEMNFRALQKRSRETTKNSRGRYNRKGRYGKSIKRHAPALFLKVLEQKLGYEGCPLNKVNTKTFKASQYNHMTDTNIPKKLSKRYILIDGRKYQRDLYSAFLLQNSEASLEHPSRADCIRKFPTFQKYHNKCISRLIMSNQKMPSCMGLKCFYAS